MRSVVVESLFCVLNLTCFVCAAAGKLVIFPLSVAAWCACEGTVNPGYTLGLRDKNYFYKSARNLNLFVLRRVSKVRK